MVWIRRSASIRRTRAPFSARTIAKLALVVVFPSALTALVIITFFGRESIVEKKKFVRIPRYASENGDLGPWTVATDEPIVAKYAGGGRAFLNRRLGFLLLHERMVMSGTVPIRFFLRYMLTSNSERIEVSVDSCSKVKPRVRKNRRCPTEISEK